MEERRVGGDEQEGGREGGREGEKRTEEGGEKEMREVRLKLPNNSLWLSQLHNHATPWNRNQKPLVVSY